ncbi:hypothetical protein FA13DRAFT_1738163 [Coprinellus micaceus]|uniref:Uncharacterized protein n=1 Tax=Coprinellus micaceus TaxID=71717 RepID=A0A4Y7RL00_COPMI|nr:hypothetical protein FA13DRAFT_1749374 [Coprinellus micaceus]TEB25659.1 hypothetical protein FA13DRAFT_1738163 [Coprinellus micaceus]
MKNQAPPFSRLTSAFASHLATCSLPAPFSASFLSLVYLTSHYFASSVLSHLCI